LAGVGMPLLVTGGSGVADFFFLVVGGAVGALTFLPAWAVPGFSFAGFCPFLPAAPEPDLGEPCPRVAVDVDEVDDEGLAGCGLGVGEAVVGAGVEVEVEVEVEVVSAGVVAVTVATGVVSVAVGVVSVAVGQDHVGPATICAPVGSSLDRSAFCATFWNTYVVWPPTPPAIVTVTVQLSADASGSAARPSTAAMEAMVAAATASVRLFNTVAYSSRGMPRHAQRCPSYDHR